jgi:hypothetical protein
LAQGKIWSADAIEAWIAQHRREAPADEAQHGESD